jgi:hypothetical protein
MSDQLHDEELNANPTLKEKVINRTLDIRAREIVADRQAAKHADDDSLKRVDLLPYLKGDIEPVTPELLRRFDQQGVDRGGMLYPRRYNNFYGDSGAGKSLVETWVMCEAMANGKHIMYLDAEEPEPNALIERCLQFGVCREVQKDNEGRWHTEEDERAIINELLHYYHPAVPLNDHWVEERIEEANEYDIAFIGIDSLGEFFGMHGVNEDRDAEVAPWLRRYVRPLADNTNAGVCSVDHATKAADNPLYPSGSKRKRAAITGAMFHVEALEPLTREAGGRLRLTTAKDRHGWFRHGDPAAIIDMRPPNPMFGLHWSVKVWTPLERDQDAVTDMKIMGMAERAIEVLHRKGPLIAGDLLVHMGKGDDHVKRTGINEAVKRGCVKEEELPQRGRPKLYTYVHDLEPDEDEPPVGQPPHEEDDF